MTDRTKKPFHITWIDSGQWRCREVRDEDTWPYDAVGYGSTPQAAINDCVLEIEMMTSDIHK